MSRELNNVQQNLAKHSLLIHPPKMAGQLLQLTISLTVKSNLESQVMPNATVTDECL